MKVLVTSSGQTLESKIDARFGRAEQFLLVDTESQAVEVVDNAMNMTAAQGAGVQAARKAAESGAQAVITGNVGPKAFRGLEAAGLRVFLCDEVTVREALERLKNGQLKEVDQANVAGHW